MNTGQGTFLCPVYTEFETKYITYPCGMSNTVFVPTEEQWQGIIPMHTKGNGKEYS